MHTKIKAILHMLIIFAVFFLSESFSDIAFQILDSGIFYDTLMCICMHILSVLIIAYLYSKYVLKQSFAEIYLGRPLPSLQWCITAFVMPVAIDAFYLFFTNGELLWKNHSRSETVYILFVSIFSQGLRISVTEGMLFRGLALSYLQKEFSKKTGVLLTSFLYTSINFVYLDTYDWTKIFLLVLATCIQNTAYALITYATGSIWSSVTVNALYNALSGHSNILHIDTMQPYYVICTYKLKSSNWLITGIPEFHCIDTAMLPIIGHLILIVLAILYVRKNNINLA